MLKVGDYVALKPNLVLGKKYGTVTFGKYHVPYLRKLMRVYKVSSTNTVYCNINGYPCECGTISEPMLNVAKFNIDELVKIVYTDNPKQSAYIGKVSTIKTIEYNPGEGFIYHIKDDCGFFDWREKDLESCTKKDENLEELSVILENDENQLQRKDFNLRSGEGVQGSRVHGRISQASIRSRPLRNAKSIRGK
jgi:hypothetical protein